MRLFIAIELSEPVRSAVCGVRDALGEASEAGRLTRRENLHLTLAFLGELPPSRAGAIRRCMQAAAGGAFSIALGRPGRFKRRGGDIWWLGVRDGTGALASLAGRLAAELRAAGFELEEREFRPHLTLGREMRMPPGFDAGRLPAPELEQPVTEITLFSSERGAGGPIYRPIFKTAL